MSEQSASLTPIRDVVAKYELTARRSLGQNYLCDINLTNKIAQSAGSLHDSTVVEIGPGPGGLTRSLLDHGAKRVIAVELDKRFGPALSDIRKHYGDRFEHVCMNGLEFNYRTLGNDPIRIFSNLPFNSGTKFLINWLTVPCWPPFWSSLTLLFQKEVADRIVARPRRKSYGRLSVLAQLRSHPQVIMSISAQAFTPVPKVNSTLVQLTPKASPIPEDRMPLFQDVVRSCFQHRRKMIRTSLKSRSADIDDAIKKSGLSPNMRPEQIPVSSFVKLFQNLL